MVRDKLHTASTQVKSESMYLGFAPILHRFEDFFIFCRKKFNGDLDRNPGVVSTFSGYFGFRHFPLLLIPWKTKYIRRVKNKIDGII
jgi:hypothetical protein